MNMVDFLPIIAVGFIASVGLTPVTRRLAQRFGMVDAPSARKVHATPIPLMGGVAIYGGFLLALLLTNRVPEHFAELAAIIAATTGLAIVGFLDDRHELSPRMKLAGQVMAALSVMIAGVRIELFNNPLDWVLTFFWLIGIVNAINFLDNMDGLAAGVSAIAAFFMFALAVTQRQELVSTMSAALCGAAVGFLLYNFNPASTFMGDLGSHVLGFLLAVSAIKLRFPFQSLEVSWMIPLLVLGVPLFDTTLVVLTRLREGRSPAQAGKDHTSHRLRFLGLSTRRTVVVLYLACVVFGLAAFAVSVASIAQAWQIGIAMGIVMVLSFILFEVVRIRQQSTQVKP